MPATRLRFLLLPLLLGLLGGCSVYDRIFHPYRLGSTRMPPAMEAEYKAREKARHQGTTLKPAEDANSGAGTDAAAAGAKPAEPKKLSYSDLSEGTKRKYDKHLLIKNHLPAPRPRHMYDRFRFKGTEANKESRKLRHHKKKGDKDKDPDPAPAKGKDATPEAAPTPAPTEAPKGN